MPNASWITLAIGARQFVVHEALRDDRVRRRVVVLVVDAHHDGDVLVLGRRRDDDLLGAAVDVRPGLGRVGEQAGRLDDDVDAEVAPRQRRRVALGEDPHGLAVDDDARRRSYVTSPRQRPRIESYLSRWASVLLSVRSLTATTSMSAPEARAAR